MLYFLMKAVAAMLNQSIQAEKRIFRP